MSDIGLIATSKHTDKPHRPEDAASIEEQITHLRKDLGELTKTVAAFGSNQVEKTGHDLAKTSQEALETVRAEVSSFEHEIRQTIRDKPLQAVGIAAGIGFIASLLTRH